jgi:O-antigen/teichoic acid export membrane protein
MFLFSKNSRSKKAAYGSIVSLILKIASVVVSFFSIPVVLAFVSKEIFGIWLVISSTFALINVLDFGLGDGLRNKFAEAKAKNDSFLQKQYISTTYFTNFILSISIILIYFIFDGFISWHKVLNISISFENELQKSTRIAIIFTSFQFFLQAILNLLKGDQRFAESSIINFSTNFISLLSILAVKLLGFKGNLIVLVVAYFAVPNIFLLIITVYLFSTRYRDLTPTVKSINTYHVKELMSLSSKFFLINILGLISLQVLNLLVIREFSATIVTDFNLLYRFYFILIAIATILFNPLWTAFTDAIVKRDNNWINTCLNQCYRYVLVLLFSIPIFIAISNKFISYWSGTPFHSSLTINILFGLWVALVIITEPIKMLIKGSGLLKSYVMISFCGTLFQILVSIAFIRLLHFKVTAVLIGVILFQLSILYILNKEKNKMLFSLRHLPNN